MSATAVVVDNGEPLLERSLLSLHDQTVKPYIIVASGPKTDLELARSLADEVLPPQSGIGRARVRGILKANSEYVLSCDSDTFYSPTYVEEAVNYLSTFGEFGFNFVKAGSIHPHEENVLGRIETLAVMLYPYEFCLAFRKPAFIELGIHECDYSNPRIDIGHYLVTRTITTVNPRMECYTRLPTKFVSDLAEYAPSIVLSSIPAGLAAGLVLLSVLGKGSPALE